MNTIKNIEARIASIELAEEKWEGYSSLLRAEDAEDRKDYDDICNKNNEAADEFKNAVTALEEEALDFAEQEANEIANRTGCSRELANKFKNAIADCLYKEYIDSWLNR